MAIGAFLLRVFEEFDPLLQLGFEPLDFLGLPRELLHCHCNIVLEAFYLLSKACDERLEQPFPISLLQLYRLNAVLDLD